MTAEEIEKYLPAVPGWTKSEGGEIRKTYSFKDFAEAMQFTNQVATVAESEGHHPDILLFHWNQVELRLSTHAIHGLHLNDFILASKIDEMWKTRFMEA